MSRKFVPFVFRVCSACKKYSFPASVITLTCIVGLAVIWIREGAHGTPASERMQTVIETETPHPIAEDEEELLLRLPCAGSVLREFSGDVPVFSAQVRMFETHKGVDFAFSGEGEVFACADGRVKRVYNDRMFGCTVEILHENGDVSRYASLKEASVREGARVKAGELIGFQGNSAACEGWLDAHLHFEYRSGGKSVQPPFALSGNP